MRTRHALPLLATLAVLGFARPADAAVNLGVGADWVEGGDGELNLTLGVDTWLARRLTLGGRAGVAFFGGTDNIAVPVDVALKLHLQRVYFEGMVGPWFMLDADDLLRVHGAFGFGLETRHGIAFGLEVGVLKHTTLLGLRLAFRI